MTMVYEDEERAIEMLRSCQRCAEQMRDAFREEGLSGEGDNWSAVVGLLEAATHRFDANTKGVETGTQTPVPPSH